MCSFNRCPSHPTKTKNQRSAEERRNRTIIVVERVNEYCRVLGKAGRVSVEDVEENGRGEEGDNEPPIQGASVAHLRCYARRRANYCADSVLEWASSGGSNVIGFGVECKNSCIRFCHFFQQK